MVLRFMHVVSKNMSTTMIIVDGIITDIIIMVDVIRILLLIK